MPRLPVLALLLCALLVVPAAAVIFKFDVTVRRRPMIAHLRWRGADRPQLPQGHRPEVDHTTMFSPEDSPASGYPGNGDTWITYNRALPPPRYRRVGANGPSP